MARTKQRQARKQAPARGRRAPAKPRARSAAPEAAAPLVERAPLPAGRYEPAIPLERLQSSPTNPRKHFDEAALRELAADLRAHGVLQPILVRRHPTHAYDYEVVAGERRYRAAKLAELATVPCMVREMDDQAVAEVQIVENAQRADLEPMAESEAFLRLREEFGWAIEEIAARIAKSPSYVRQRIALSDLVPAAAKMLREGSLPLASAIRLARIDASAQTEILSELRRWARNTSPTPAWIAEQIERRASHPISAAPWSIDDAELLPAAGACGPCPRRSKIQDGLFADAISKQDRCLDGRCWSAKREAHERRLASAAEARGLLLVPAGAKKEAWPHSGYEAETFSTRTFAASGAQVGGRYSGTPTWGKLLGRRLPPATHFAVHESGVVVEVHTVSALRYAAKRAGATAAKAVKSAASPTGYKPSAADRKRDLARKAIRIGAPHWQERVAVHGAAWVDGLDSDAKLRAIAGELLEVANREDAAARVCSRRGLAALQGSACEAIRTLAAGEALSLGELVGLAWEMIFLGALKQWSPDPTCPLDEHYGSFVIHQSFGGRDGFRKLVVEQMEALKAKAAAPKGRKAKAAADAPSYDETGEEG